MKKRSLLKLMLVNILLCLSFASHSQEAMDEVSIPDSLNREAIITNKATKSVLLTSASAGNRMVAAGERGIIIISDDNGSNWKQITVPTSANIVTLKFIDERNGWATGHMGVILNTNDGGITWVKQLDGLQAAKLAIKAVAGSGNKKAIKEANYLLKDGPDKPFFDIDMQADGHGIAVGAFNIAFETEDAGKHWHYLSHNIHNKLSRHLHQVNKVKSGYVIFGEQGLILYSNDQGKSFNQINSPYNGTWFGMIQTRDGSWVAYGLKGNAYVSHDQGQSWLKIAMNTTTSISAATQMRDGTVILATQAGELFAGTSNNSNYQLIKQLAGFPITSILEAGSGDLVVTGLRGVLKVNKNEMKNQ